MFEFVIAASVPDIRVDYSVFFVVGLLGGAHCLGMCGPLVTMYSDRLTANAGPDRVGWYEIRQHLLFNVGRTIGYALVGATMGALGAAVFDAAAVASVADGVRAAVGIAVGTSIMLVGVTYGLRGRLPQSIPWGGRFFSRVTATMTDYADHWVAGPRIVGLGMLHGLLPCPILYPAFMYAFARGSPVDGLISLGLLGLGTLPTLFAYGTAFQSLRPETRERLHRVLGIAFVVLGYLPLSMGLAALGVQVPRADIPIYRPFG